MEPRRLPLHWFCALAGRRGAGWSEGKRRVSKTMTGTERSDCLAWFFCAGRETEHRFPCQMSNVISPIDVIARICNDKKIRRLAEHSYSSSSLLLKPILALGFSSGGASNCFKASKIICIFSSWADTFLSSCSSFNKISL